MEIIHGLLIEKAKALSEMDASKVITFIKGLEAGYAVKASNMADGEDKKLKTDLETSIGGLDVSY